MWKNLDEKKKNVLFVVATLVVVYIAYVFSFSPTLKVIQVNRQLAKEQNQSQNFDATLPQLSDQHSYYLNALKAYQVRTEDRENRLWQTVSGAAVAKNVTISFNPNIQQAPDSVAIKNRLVTQQFNFKGNYFDQVQLLDSLSKTKGIGMITELRLAVPKEKATDGKTNQLTLQLTLSGMVK